MTRFSHEFLVASVAGFLAASSATHAAVNFSNTLRGFDGRHSQEAVSGGVANQPSFATDNGFEFARIFNGTNDANAAWETVKFSSQDAQFGTNQRFDNGRNYLRTTETDYATTSFVAEVTIVNPGGDQQAWFGMGDGRVADFGQPDAGQTDTASIIVEYSGGNTATMVSNNGYTYNPIGFIGNNGATRLRLTYDAVAKTMLVAADSAFDGTFDADASSAPLDLSTFFTNGENSRIYVGGDDGVIFSDLVVTVPEPASLLAMSALAFAASRRRPATPRR